MGLFSKPKKKKKIAVGKGTQAEELKAEFNMKRRYPQMQDPNWGKPTKKQEEKEEMKNLTERQLLSSEDRTEIDKRRDKKGKK